MTVVADRIRADSPLSRQVRDYRLVSTTHHAVYVSDDTHGSGDEYVKCSTGTPWSSAKEHELFEALSGRCCLGFAEGRSALFMEAVGDRPAAPLPLGQQMSVLDRVHAWTGTPRHVPVARPVPDARVKIMRRCRQARAPRRVQEWFTSVLSAVDIGLCATVPDRLVVAHTDPHAQNWCVPQDGDPVLVDWESAVLAGPEHDYAAVLHTLFVGDSRDPVSALGEYVAITDVVRELAVLKAVKSASHQMVTYGLGALYARHDGPWTRLTDALEWSVPCRLVPDT